MNEVRVGVDVSNLSLDVAVRPRGESWPEQNSHVGIQAFDPQTEEAFPAADRVGSNDPAHPRRLVQLGSAQAFRHMVGHIGASAGLQAFVPDYRLAPKHAFSARQTMFGRPTSV